MVSICKNSQVLYSEIWLNYNTEHQFQSPVLIACSMGILHQPQRQEEAFISQHHARCSEREWIPFEKLPPSLTHPGTKCINPLCLWKLPLIYPTKLLKNESAKYNNKSQTLKIPHSLNDKLKCVKCVVVLLRYNILRWLKNIKSEIRITFW